MFSSSADKLALDANDEGPWVEAVKYVLKWQNKMNDFLAGYRGQGLKYDNFQCTSTKRSFYDDFDSILESIGKDSPQTMNEFQLRSVNVGFKKLVIEFTEGFEALELYVLISAFSNKKGYLMFDMFRQYNGKQFESKTITGFTTLFGNGILMGFFYKVI